MVASRLDDYVMILKPTIYVKIERPALICL